VRAAVERVQEDNIGNVALLNALIRARERVAIPDDAIGW
jgi:hypothetical protein